MCLIYINHQDSTMIFPELLRIAYLQRTFRSEECGNRSSIENESRQVRLETTSYDFQRINRICLYLLNLFQAEPSVHVKIVRRRDHPNVTSSLEINFVNFAYCN